MVHFDSQWVKHVSWTQYHDSWLRSHVTMNHESFWVIESQVGQNENDEKEKHGSLCFTDRHSEWSMCHGLLIMNQESCIHESWIRSHMGHRKSHSPGRRAEQRLDPLQVHDVDGHARHLVRGADLRKKERNYWTCRFCWVSVILWIKARLLTGWHNRFEDLVGLSLIWLFRRTTLHILPDFHRPKQNRADRPFTRQNPGPFDYGNAVPCG